VLIGIATTRLTGCASITLRSIGAIGGSGGASLGRIEHCPLAQSCAETLSATKQPRIKLKTISKVFIMIFL